MIWLILGVASATPQWEALRSDDGWTEVATKSSALGPVVVRSKPIGGLTCLEGAATADVPVNAIASVADDMASAASWTRANLLDSTELRRDADGFVLYQYLDVPDWTFTADRYWVIHGQVQHQEIGATYSWFREDATDFPDAQRNAHQHSGSALEPPVNFGEWTFTPVSAGTYVRYRTCADFGGNVPGFVTNWLATSQVPQTLVDLVSEAERRHGG